MKKKSGFTLVELIIGMAVTMVALAAAFVLFRDSTKANTNVTQTSGMSDNIRAGLNLIVQDLIQTGTGIPTGGITIPNSVSSGCNSKARRVNRPPAALNLTVSARSLSRSRIGGTARVSPISPSEAMAMLRVSSCSLDSVAIEIRLSTASRE